MTPATGLPQLTEERAAEFRNGATPEPAPEPELATALGPATEPEPATIAPENARPPESAPRTDTASEADAAEAEEVTESDAAPTPAAIAPDGLGGGPGDTVIVPAIAETEPAGTGTNPAPSPPVAEDELGSGNSHRWFSSRRERAEPSDYWDADGGAQLAGQVYPPMETADTRLDLPADALGGSDAHASGQQRPAPELDDDAPPFATAPFAPVPRLNRVRAAPTPPVDPDEDEDK